MFLKFIRDRNYKLQDYVVKVRNSAYAIENNTGVHVVLDKFFDHDYTNTTIHRTLKSESLIHETDV